MLEFEKRFLARLSAAFGDPGGSDDAATVIEYANAIAGTTPEILDAAATAIIRDRKYRSWPSISECLDAIRREKDWAAARKLSRGLSAHVLTPADVQWDDWMRHLNACNQLDLLAEAQEIREITVVGSKWPSAASPLPKVSTRPATGLSARSRAMTGAKD